MYMNNKKSILTVAHPPQRSRNPNITFEGPRSSALIKRSTMKSLDLRLSGAASSAASVPQSMSHAVHLPREVWDTRHVRGH